MVNSSHPEIAIIGSSLSGLSLALHLSAQNTTCTVYEYRPSSYSQGGDIALSPNATPWQETCSADAGEYFGFSAVRLKRIAVKETLLKECEKRGVEIVFRKEFVRLEENDGEVRVFFKDGDVIGTDLVIGADGFRSRVRGFIEPEAKATYMEKNGARLPMPSMLFGKDGSFTAWRRDFAAREIGFFANILLPDRSREEWEKVERDKEDLRKILEKTYCHGAWPEQVQVMCREAPPEEFHIWPTNTVPHLASWSSPSGKVILIGDAAHAIAPSVAREEQWHSKMGKHLPTLYRGLEKIQLP
ncbi:FAD/NAD(P)-binding domain-containing protein [Hyaloscypha hepaticicola]|uniref:FAD/NAD(P)-binding domain-containing protein n=1 Tax=Hyaloscypha hepaticicola TaxID=2082293 RepID=A0A2J6Q4B5_9HELO|nr:FAD/NAD(P)-binding domain-containing protein [Hyaloscypha hepaticicola]